MKVNTSLKSGNFIDDTVQWVDQEAAKVGKFFVTADRQARSLTGAVSNAAQSAYHSVKNWIAGW